MFTFLKIAHCSQNLIFLKSPALQSPVPQIISHKVPPRKIMSCKVLSRKILPRKVLSRKILPAKILSCKIMSRKVLPRKAEFFEQKIKVLNSVQSNTQKKLYFLFLSFERRIHSGTPFIFFFFFAQNYVICISSVKYKQK